ncbi:hypothetical protein [Thermosynechococcus vestitus]|uniref:Tsl1229 protein n=1 Tax=Thermosynechococcus vestitus (strain NIES-2133 / IAM M-273 / BP-1) TaxID=197221 RepID=Q8DJJ4_THEVB|nr:hypothetical protein [Thermosynechococcus vestitus]BAC08781.1 tsl1229 [Thermosynechococcus vestitus BP-1]
MNGIRLYRDSDGSIRRLIKDNRGLISLPIWIDRQSSQGTFERFRLVDEFEAACWVTIP